MKLSAFLLQSMKLEPREGIEPPIGDYKSPVIPFNYRGNGFHCLNVFNSIIQVCEICAYSKDFLSA